MAVEQITGITPPERGLYLRVIYAELERIICHLGDLAGICLDVAFGFGAFQFRLLRNWCYQLADLLCGSRFLRSVNVPGGVRIDRIAEINTDMMKRLQDIRNELEDTIKILHRHTMLTDRIEHTGVLAEKIAFDLNVVGPAARASGIPRDIRKDLCYGVYNQLSFEVPVESGGDVAARMNIKIEECYQSLSLISQALMNIPQGKTKTEIPSIPPFVSAFGITEAPRGENVHWLMTDQDGFILRYKIRTPSFCNWPGVCHAVSGNIVPDFPLINKSFNLSYAGNDL